MLNIYTIGFAAGVLSLMVFLLGCVGLLAAPSLLSAVVVVVVCLFWFLKRQSITVTFPREKRRFMLPLALFISVMLPLVLLPPTARDDLVMHLALPKLYLESGRIHEIPFMGFSYVPININFLYLIPLAFGNDIMPKLVHFSFALLTGFLLYAYLLRKLEQKYAILALFLYVTTPVVIQLSTTAYIDLGLTLYSTLALLGILQWREAFDLKWLILSAVSTGFALGAKYSALILLFVFCLTVIWSYSRATKNQLKAIQLGLLYFLIAAAVFSPWLIRNLLWTHNPIYPIAQSLFTGSASLEQGHHLSALPPLKMRHDLYGEDLWHILLVPLRLFWEGQDGSIQHFDGVLNPLVLFFVPFAFAGIKNRDMKYLGFFAVVFFYIAFFTIDLVTRYLMPVLPVLIIFTVYGVKRAFEIKRIKPLALVALIGVFLFNAWYIVGLYKHYQPLMSLFRESREQYLSRMVPDYPTVEFANAKLPANAKVMFLFTGDRGYYWERTYYYGDRMGGDIIQFVKESSNEKELARKFKDLGITHLFMRDALIAKFAKDNFNDEQNEMLRRFYKSSLRWLYGQNGYALFELAES